MSLISTSLTENAIILADHRQLTSGESSSVNKGATGLYSSMENGRTPCCTQTETMSQETCTTYYETVQFPPPTKPVVISSQGGEKLDIICIQGGENATESLMGALSNHAGENAAESPLTSSY